ncbi:G-protein coupled receptor-like protein [Dinothrombium tinctorium]|uniref:G-protein coupled receptor-like protein n=1 Tax=Dinothrombium tinctorium TaxID=1965070 RepID=A0A443QU62_9ACAR|nr:G-protein coupled receptor-like protein [Dinothrombium tinctorium]
MNETIAAASVWTSWVIVSFPIVVFIILFTVISNILVIYAIFTYPTLKSCQNLLLVSLAIADITNAIFVMPLNVYWNVNGPWPFNSATCIFHLTSDSFLCTTSIINLVAIAIDRYWAIYDPINYTYKRTTKLIIIMSVTAWTVGFVITVFPLITLTFLKVFQWPENACFYPRGYILYVTVGQFILPLIVMSIVYYLIYKAIRKQLNSRKQKAGNVFVMASHEKSSTSQDTSVEMVEEDSSHLSNQAEPTKHSTDQQNQQVGFVKEREKISIAKERRAVRVLGVVVGVFVACWAPYFIMDDLFFFVPSIVDKTPLVIINFIYWLGYFNSACNPIIYTIFNREFRKAFKKILRIK